MLNLEIQKLVTMRVKIRVITNIKKKIRNIEEKIDTLKYFDKILLNIFLN